VGRFAGNEPCPCGSGIKFKRCCLGREGELERRADALEVLAGLGSLFPLMRPCGGEFEPWLAAHASGDPTTETIEEGIARLTDKRRREIIDAHASRYPDVWRGLVEDAGGSDVAERVAITGAVTAALTEPREPYAAHLAFVVDEEDPAEALALALDGTNLWSIGEATLLDEALAAIDDGLADSVYEKVWDAMLDEAAQVFWSDAHARRLEILIQRLRASLPTLKPAQASRVLAEACDAFAEHEDVRPRLAAMLLTDTLDELDRVTQALAA
jgi:SEC-C motif